LAEEIPKPEAANGQKSHGMNRNVRPPDVVMEIGGNLPEQINITHAHNQQGNEHKLARLPLQIAGKEQRERQGKVQDNQTDHNDLPMPFDPVEVPANLLHNVSGPDDQPLGK